MVFACLKRNTAKSRSLVWDYFTINSAKNTMVCDLCNDSLALAASSARNHLKFNHNDTYYELLERESGKKQKIENALNTVLSLQENFDMALSVFLSKANIPISIVADQDFHSLFQAYERSVKVNFSF